MKMKLGIALVIFGFAMPFISTWLFGIPKVVSTLSDPWQWIFALGSLSIMVPGIMLLSWGIVDPL